MPTFPLGLIRAFLLMISIVLFAHLNWLPRAYSEAILKESEYAWPTGEKRQHRRSSVSIRERAGFITRDETFLGTIYHSMGEAYLLHTGDLALIDVGMDQALQVGEYLTIFGTSPMVQHQTTGAVFGQPIRMLGVAKLVQVEETTSMIRITDVFGEILLGDRVERYGVLPPEVTTIEPSVNAVWRPDTASSFGSIQSAKDDKLALAAGDIVFIDQGALQGVKLGDRFWVYNERRTAHHPDTDQLLPVAPQPIGELRIVDVQADSSTAHVESSRYEFGVGAMVRLADSSASAFNLASASTVESLLALTPPCLEQARAAIQAARASGARPQELAEAESALAYASKTYEQAQSLLEQGNREQALQLLQAVEADCLRAQHLAGEINWRMASQSGDRYIVQPGDSLWGIAARPAIYRDPLLWPILYRGNRDRLNDPDMIYPRQELMVPRGYSQDEANAARQRARTRGPWRLGDGPDDYILDGFQP